MIPRFSNPHVLSHHYKITSRSEYDEGVYDPPEQDEEDLSRLHTYVTSSLEFLDSDFPRKRRKLTVSSDDNSQVTVGRQAVFRLVSTTRPPQNISLESKPPKVFRPIERKYEDDEEELTRRRERALQVAIDYTWLVKETIIEHSHVPSRKTTALNISIAKSHPDHSVMVLADQPNATNASVSASRTDTDGHTSGAPRLCCPLVAMKPAPSDAMLVSQHRRMRQQSRRRKQNNLRARLTERPCPHFFRPDWNLGGKSAGYAMGYAGSRPYDWSYGNPVHYVRDRMKRAVMAS